MSAGTAEVVTESFAYRSAGVVNVRLLRVVLWMLVIAGPTTAGWVAAQLGAVNGELAAVTDQVAQTAPTVNTAGVEGLAELAVADFLGEATGEPGGAAGHEAVRMVSVGADEVAAGYFAVTVAVSHPISGVGFYTIGVASTGAGWAATSAPSRVAAPAVGVPPMLAVAQMGGIEELELEQALGGFLAALLAGDGDIGRYVAPGSSVTAVTPAPFTTVEVVAAGSVMWADGTQLVMVEVEGIDDGGSVQSLAYSLVMAERDGRWEVIELLAAPPLANTGSENQARS